MGGTRRATPTTFNASSTSLEQEYADMKSYRIPGSAGDPWDTSIHGLPYDDNGELEMNGTVVPVEWEPGRYEFNYAASGHTFTISDPEPQTMREPNQRILRGFHAFLTEALEP